MKIVGIHNFKTPHTCDICGAETDRAGVVMTLAGSRDEPAEYAWACTECGCLDSFTLVPEPDDDGDLESVRLAARSVKLPDGSQIASADEVRRRIGKAVECPHETKVTYEGRRLYRACCSCGWRGLLYADDNADTLAQDDANRHESDMSHQEVKPNESF